MAQLPELLAKKDNATFEEVSRFRSFMQSDQSGTLSSAHLQLIFKLLKSSSGLSSTTRREYFWAILANLSKFEKGSHQERPTIPSSGVATLIEILLECSEAKANNMVLGILTSLVRTSGCFRLDKSSLKQLIRLHECLEKDYKEYNLVVHTFLRLLHDNISSKNFHPSVVNVMKEYLGLGSNSSVRIQSATWFYRWTVELGMSLDKGELSVLQKYLQDDVREVKLYSRAAYSNGLWNNVKLRADEGMLHMLPNIFVTYITEITEVGGLQKDLTEKINGPIYKIFASPLVKLPQELGEIYRKFAMNYAKLCTPSSNPRAFKQCLKAIGDWCMPGTLEAVEKVFNMTEEETDCAEYVQFISTAITNGLSKGFTVAATTLQKIVKRMLGPKSHACIYPMALHIISGIQELPDDVFGYYHMEMVALRLKNGGLGHQAYKFLKESNLDQGDDDVLMEWLHRHFRNGRRLSHRSMDALLNCCKAKETEIRAVRVLHGLVAQGLIFGEAALLRLMDKDASEILKSRLLFDVMVNQDIPRQVLSRIFKYLEGLPVTWEHVGVPCFVEPLLKNHSNPCEITERSVNLTVRFLEKAVKRADRTGWMFMGIARDILLTALVTKDLQGTSLQQVKKAIMVEKNFHRYVGKERKRYDTEKFPSCDLVLMLELLDYDTNFFSWAEINELIVRANENIWKMETKIQKRMYLLYRCNSEQGCHECTSPTSNESCGNIPTAGEERPHVYFDVLALKFCKMEVPLTKSACNFVVNGSGLSAPPFVDTSNLEEVMQGSGKVAEKIMNKMKTELPTSHLQIIGDCTFRAWANSQNTEAYNHSILLLECLWGNGWEPSEEAKESLRLLNHYGGPWMESKFCQAWPVALLTTVLSQDIRDEGWERKLMYTAPCAQTQRNLVAQVSSTLCETFSIVNLRAQANVQIFMAKIYLVLANYKKEHLLQHIVEECGQIEAGSDDLCIFLVRIYSYIEAVGSHLNHSNIKRLLDKSTALAMVQDLQNKLEQKSLPVGMLIRAGRLLQACYPGQVQLPILAKMTSVRTVQGLDELVELLSKVDAEIVKNLPLVKSEVELIVEVTAGFVLSKIPSKFSHLAEEIDSLIRPMLTNKAITLKNLLEIKDWKGSYVEHFVQALKVGKNYSLKNFNKLQDISLAENGFNFETVVPSEAKTKHIKSTPEIIDEFMLHGKLTSSKRDLVKFVADVRGMYRKSTILQGRGIQDISTWNQSTIKLWASTTAKKTPDEEHIAVKEYLSVARRAFEILRGWRLTTVQILAAKCALEKPHGRTLLQQISTGLGKSTIIALVAGFQALSGKNVDVYTSSPVLAQRDQEEWTEFYELFNLTCGHNVDFNYHGGSKPCYVRHIVYGDIKQFQFDVLRHDYLGLETRGKRAHEYCIVDEVDSSFLDEAAKLAILSTPVAGMELLHLLYLKIWKIALKLNNLVNVYRLGNRYYTYQGDQEISLDAFKLAANNERIPSRIYDRRTFIQKHLETYILALLGDTTAKIHESLSMPDPLMFPTHLQDFAKSQVHRYSDSALTAMALELDKDYVVLDDQVFPLDPNNGVTQRNSNWANALHQFLQIKHQLKVTPETLSTAFISNMGVLGKYNGNIVGFSGTLGLRNSADRQPPSTKSAAEIFYDSQENIDVIHIPDPNLKRFWMFPEVLTTSKKEWLSSIADAARFEARYRAVLIICCTIKDAREVDSAIAKLDSSLNVLLHVQSEEEENHTTLQIDAGTIVTTTNLGARGTDIKTTNIEKFGGLHVILTYLPASERTEAQALGRTARQGKFGSAQYIIKCSKDATMKIIQERRNQNEADKLKTLANDLYPSIKEKDIACGHYMASFGRILDSFRKKPSQAGPIQQVKRAAWRTTLSEFDWAILDAYQESWAFHLKKETFQMKWTDGIPPNFPSTSTHNASCNFNYRNALEVFELTKSCFHPIRYGFQFYKEHKHYPLLDTAKDSEKYFKLAIKYDPLFAVGAYVGLAYLSLRGGKVLDIYQIHEDNYKEIAIRHLSTSLKLLSNELAQLETTAEFFPECSPAGRHFRDKIALHEKYIGVILHTREVVESSFRRIYCKRSVPGEATTEVIPLSPNCYKLPFKQLSSSSEFTLSCYGLTYKKDVIKSYQGLSAIKFAQKNLQDRRLISLEISGAHQLMKLSLWPQVKLNQLMELLDGTTDRFVYSFNQPLYQHLDTLNLEAKLRTASSAKLVISGGRKYLQEVTNCISKVCKNSSPIQITVTEDNAASAEVNACQLHVSQLMHSLENVPLLAGQNPRVTLSLSFEEPWNLVETLKKLTTANSVQINTAAHGEDSQTEVNLEHKMDVQIEVEVKHCHLQDSINQFGSLRSIQLPELLPSECLALLEIFMRAGIEPSIHFHHLNFTQANEILERLQKPTREHLTQVKVLCFNELFSECKYHPVDILTEMKNRGLQVVAEFTELNGFRPTAAIIVGLVAMAQLSTGLALSSTGLGLFATPLLAGFWKCLWELLVSNGVSKEFSMKSFATKQAFGLAFGLGCISTFDDIAAQSLSKMKVSAVGKALSLPFKALIVKCAGFVGEEIEKETRENMIKLAQELIGKFLEGERIRVLLANFYAINRAEQSEDACGLSLDFYLYRWLSSDPFVSSHARRSFWKDMYASAINTGFGHALNQLPKLNAGVAVGGGLALSAIISRGIELIVKTERIESTVQGVCKAIQMNLEEHLRTKELAHILTHYCSLTETQVTKLNLPKSCAASIDPFNSDHLPADAKNLDFITEIELEHARHRLKVLSKYKAEAPWGEAELSSLVANLATFVVDEMIGNISLARFESDLSGTSQTSPARDEDKLQNSQVFYIQDAPQTVQAMKGTEATECVTHESSRPWTLIELVDDCQEIVFLFLTANLLRRPAEAVEAITKAVLYIEKKKLDVQIIDSLTCKAELMASIQQSPRAIFIGLQKDLSIEFVQVHERNNQPSLFKTDKFEGPDSMEKALGCLTGVPVEEIKGEMVEQRASATAIYDKLLCIFESILSLNQQ